MGLNGSTCIDRTEIERKRGLFGCYGSSWTQRRHPITPGFGRPESCSQRVQILFSTSVKPGCIAWVLHRTPEAQKAFVSWVSSRLAVAGRLCDHLQAAEFTTTLGFKGPACCDFCGVSAGWKSRVDGIHKDRRQLARSRQLSTPEIHQDLKLATVAGCGLQPCWP